MKKKSGFSTLSLRLLPEESELTSEDKSYKDRLWAYSGSYRGVPFRLAIEEDPADLKGLGEGLTGYTRIEPPEDEPLDVILPKFRSATKTKGVFAHELGHLLRSDKIGSLGSLVSLPRVAEEFVVDYWVLQNFSGKLREVSRRHIRRHRMQATKRFGKEETREVEETAIRESGYTGGRV